MRGPWGGEGGLRGLLGSEEPQGTSLMDKGEGSGWAGLDPLCLPGVP